MSQTKDTKRQTIIESDLDDSIFAILNSPRPTYPGGAPMAQNPHTQPISRPAQPSAQPQTTPEEPTEWRPTIRPNAGKQESSASKPTQPTIQQESVFRSTQSTTQQESTFRPTQPITQQESVPESTQQPPLQKRPIISHAFPDQEDHATEEWPNAEDLEEAPEFEPKPGIFHRIKKPWLLIAIAYVIILLLGFSVRILVHTIQKHQNATDTPSIADNQITTTIPNDINNAEAEVQTTAEAGKAEIVDLKPATAFLAVLENNTANIKVSISAHGTVGASNLLWTSSDETIATVDESGNVTGISAGKCVITVSAKQNPEISADIPVAIRHLENRAGCTYIDDILIVNKSYSLPESYDPGGLTPETAEAFFQLSNDAAEEGYNIYVGSDYRPYADQLRIYQEYCLQSGWEEADTYSARPGYSEHQTGMVIDCNSIDDAFGETPESDWLAEHCAEYGFIIHFLKGKEDITGYQYEPWHIRYVGVETAKEIHELGISLEEYLGVDSHYQTTWPEDPANPDALS